MKPENNVATLYIWQVILIYNILNKNVTIYIIHNLHDIMNLRITFWSRIEIEEAADRLKASGNERSTMINKEIEEGNYDENVLCNYCLWHLSFCPDPTGFGRRTFPKGKGAGWGLKRKYLHLKFLFSILIVKFE